MSNVYIGRVKSSLNGKYGHLVVACTIYCTCKLGVFKIYIF